MIYLGAVIKILVVCFLVIFQLPEFLLRIAAKVWKAETQK